MDNRKQRRANKANARKSQFAPAQPQNQGIPENIGFFFMACAEAVFTKDENVRQRRLNVLLQSNSPDISKADLNTLQRTVLERLKNENDVTPDQVKDVIFLSINMLGAMDPDRFHADPQNVPVDEAAADPA